MKMSFNNLLFDDTSVPSVDASNHGTSVDSKVRWMNLVKELKESYKVDENIVYLNNKEGKIIWRYNDNGNFAFGRISESDYKCIILIVNRGERYECTVIDEKNYGRCKKDMAKGSFSYGALGNISCEPKILFDEQECIKYILNTISEVENGQ